MLPVKVSISERDRAVLAKTYFILGLALAGMPFHGKTQQQIFPLMFPDSKMAKQFQCGKRKVSYIVSDGLGPYFKKVVIDELNRAGVYYSIQIDKTPIPKQ